MTYDLNKIRADFPILSTTVPSHRGRENPLIYLDNAASAQKPNAVLEAIEHCYKREYANIHRGIHYLSRQTTDAYERARYKVKEFLNAPRVEEIVFTRSSTEAFNLLAHSFSRRFCVPGDNIILSVMEHHANIVPWQLIQSSTGLVLKVVRIDDQGSLDLEHLVSLIDDRTRLISLTHCSNVLGSVTPASEIARIAHEREIAVAFDGSQAVAHQATDVQAIDADFYIFTGHKLYGPNAIGVLYGKYSYLEAMPPYQGGGDMIANVSFQETTFKPPPTRFEAGTPPIVEAISLVQAIEYVEVLGWQAIHAHEHSLLSYLTEGLNQIDGLSIIGNAPEKAAIVSFILDGIHPHDAGMLIDLEGIAVRVGHHCAEPLMEHLGIESTTRASFALYNTHDEAQALIDTVQEVIRFLR